MLEKYFKSIFISQVVVIHKQNYNPNPFNPSKRISYSVPEIEFVTLKVIDGSGNKITTLINEEKPAGSYEVEFNGKELQSGVYFYKLKSDGYFEIKKMVLLR